MVLPMISAAGRRFFFRTQAEDNVELVGESLIDLTIGVASRRQPSRLRYVPWNSSTRKSTWSLSI